MSCPRSPLELVSFQLCPYAQRVMIVLNEKSVDFHRTNISLANKPDWFTAISPLGKVPLLRVDANVLFESSVICEYVNDVTPGDLHPTDPLERAWHRAWIEFGSSLLGDIAALYSVKTQSALDAALQKIAAKAAWLEQHLEARPFFFGEAFQLVDAVYPTVFRYFVLFDQLTDFRPFAATPKVRAYRKAVMARPAVQSAVHREYLEDLHAFILAKESALADLARHRSMKIA